MIAHITRHSIVLAAVSGLIALLALAGVLAASAAGWRLPMFAGHPEADPLLLIAGLQLVITLQLSVFYNVFKGIQEVYWAAFYQGLGRLLALAGAMLAAWLTRSVAVVMIAQLFFVALLGALAAVHVWRRHPWAFKEGSWWDWAQYRAQIRIGGKNFLIQIGQTLGYTAPTFAISSILGPAAVPFYTVPVTLLSLFFTPINSWSASMQNAYGEAWVSGAIDWTRNAFRDSLERMLVLGGLGVSLFLSVGDNVIRIWTHGRLWLGPSMAASVSAFVFAVTLIKAAECLLIGLNRQRRAAVAEMANGLLSMVLVPLSVRWLGMGAVGAGAVGAVFATSVWVLRREIRAQLGRGSFPTAMFAIRTCLAVAAAAIVGKFVGNLGDNHDLGTSLLRLLLGGLSGLTVFAAAVMALKLVPIADAFAFGRWLKQRVAASPV